MTLSDYPLVIVTPVFEDLEASSRLFKEIGAIYGPDVSVIAIDDGSVAQRLDESLLEQAHVDGVILTLRRNVGHQRAIAIGLSYAAERLQEGQTVVVMDSDGEDAPGTIRHLLLRLDVADIDVVVAKRRSRVETLRFKAFYLIYRCLFKFLTGRRIRFGNFSALKPHAVRRLSAMQELPIHIAGTILASRLRVAFCPIDRAPRYAGKSKMNFVGLALHGFKGLMVFAEDVLVRVGIACSLMGGLAVGGSLLAVFLKLVGFSTPGWFSIALGILVLIVLQTGALALMSLMLTGVMRSGSILSASAYSEFIEQVTEVDAQREAA